ncbi:MAG: hypothetical protein PHP96_00865 [Candidatus Dojkabacteria bacterium]|jgi:hypothetical protein|nr:hypothetical protein [Candidatus Dojkabacteria bacterium]MDD4560865.1 hypothetical protein [Candidatus Dojkabacteria bacterium]NLB12051.1 hypothetical protein [Candidatus Dojkabacteria bacterium]
MNKTEEKGKNLYKPKDREGGFPSDMPYIQRRFFETIPGIFTWTLLLLPVIFALLRWEIALVVYISFLVAYWLFRTIKFAIGAYIGVRRMEEEKQIDWVGKIKELNSDKFSDLRYIYLCPVYGESLEILEPSFKAWSESDIGAKKIDVVVAMEEAKKDLQIENFNTLKQKYGNKFGSMRYYIHPAGIPGEIIGVKGANINYAARELVKDLEKEGKKISNYLVATCDSDLRPHPKYLSAITYRYLTSEKPFETFYASAVHSFNNNIWNVPPIIRTQSNMLTLVVLHYWVLSKDVKIPFTGERLHTKDTFSSYVVNLKTLKEIEFWDPEIPNDDTAFYWNSILRSKGEFRSEEVYVPTYNDAVENKTFIKSHVSFYKQQYRWGWGIINYPISLAILFQDRENFPVYRKVLLSKTMFEYLWFLTVVFVLTFGLNIMGWLNPAYQYTVFAYNLPRILSYIFSVIMLSNIVIVVSRRKITPIPKGWKWWRHILDFFETFLIAFNMITFSFIPYMQAITEMMFGRGKFKRNFYVTEKVRIEKE